MHPPSLFPRFMVTLDLNPPPFPFPPPHHLEKRPAFWSTSELNDTFLWRGTNPRRLHLDENFSCILPPQRTAANTLSPPSFPSSLRPQRSPHIPPDLYPLIDASCGFSSRPSLKISPTVPPLPATPFTSPGGGKRRIVIQSRPSFPPGTKWRPCPGQHPSYFSQAGPIFPAATRLHSYASSEPPLNTREGRRSSFSSLQVLVPYPRATSPVFFVCQVGLLIERFF